MAFPKKKILKLNESFLKASEDGIVGMRERLRLLDREMARFENERSSKQLSEVALLDSLQEIKMECIQKDISKPLLCKEIVERLNVENNGISLHESEPKASRAHQRLCLLEKENADLIDDVAELKKKLDKQRQQFSEMESFDQPLLTVKVSDKCDDSPAQIVERDFETEPPATRGEQKQTKQVLSSTGSSKDEASKHFINHMLQNSGANAACWNALRQMSFFDDSLAASYAEQQIHNQLTMQNIRISEIELLQEKMSNLHDHETKVSSLLHKSWIDAVSTSQQAYRQDFHLSSARNSALEANKHSQNIKRVYAKAKHEYHMQDLYDKMENGMSTLASAVTEDVISKVNQGHRAAAVFREEQAYNLATIDFQYQDQIQNSTEFTTNKPDTGRIDPELFTATNATTTNETLYDRKTMSKLSSSYENISHSNSQLMTSSNTRHMDSTHKHTYASNNQFVESVRLPVTARVSNLRENSCAMADVVDRMHEVLNEEVIPTCKDEDRGNPEKDPVAAQALADVLTQMHIIKDLRR